MPAPKKYPDELRERAVRLVAESGRPIAHVANDLGVHREALRQWVRQAEADAGTRRDRLTTTERERRAAPQRMTELTDGVSAPVTRASERPRRIAIGLGGATAASWSRPACLAAESGASARAINVFGGLVVVSRDDACGAGAN